MATVTSLTCDKCGSTRNVETVAWRRGGAASVEADLCMRCHREVFGPVNQIPRRATDVIKRPVRFKKVEVPEQP